MNTSYTWGGAYPAKGAKGCCWTWFAVQGCWLSKKKNRKWFQHRYPWQPNGTKENRSPILWPIYGPSFLTLTSRPRSQSFPPLRRKAGGEKLWRRGWFKSIDQLSIWKVYTGTEFRLSTNTNPFDCQSGICAQCTRGQIHIQDHWNAGQNGQHYFQ